MNLSRKIVLVIVSTFIALIFIIAVTSDIILLNSFAELEKKVLKDNVSKVTNELEETFPELEVTAKDYVESFMKGGAGQINNLKVDSFSTHRIDFIACYKSTGELVAGNAANSHLNRRNELTDDQWSALQKATSFVVEQSGNKNGHGFLALGPNMAQFAMRPFVDRSVLVVGRFIDKEELKRVSTLTQFKIEVIPFESESMSEDFLLARESFQSGTTFHSAVVDKGHIAGYSLLTDIYGKPVMMLKITDQRLVYEKGKASMTYILLALIISGVLFCGVMLLFIRGAVLKRLAKLSSTVGEISSNRDISVRLEIRGEDELEDLAQSINTMLSSLEAAEQSLRESEERYRALFERAPDSIFIISNEADEPGRIVDVNLAACEQHGYSYDELRTMRIQDLNTPEANKMAKPLMERIIRGEWVTQELWHVRKDGSIFPIEIHAGPIRLGGCTYVLGFDRDITSRKLAEESDRMYLEQIHNLNAELARQAASLELANKELETFNYSVSHDMRGPLTRISGYCQLLLDDDSGIDPQARTYVSRIYESGAWLDKMIDAMLKLSQLVRADLFPVPVNLSEICREQLDSMLLAEPGRVVETVVAPGVTALGDEGLLKILVNNLINNAWKYSSRCSNGFIEFGVVENGPATVYFVRDNGAGFEMKDAARLFLAFTRMHDPTLYSGSGIGLATVHRIVTRHGGRIWAEGEVGRGATFFFTLAPEVGPILAAPLM